MADLSKDGLLEDIKNANSLYNKKYLEFRSISKTDYDAQLAKVNELIECKNSIISKYDNLIGCKKRIVYILTR